MNIYFLILSIFKFIILVVLFTIIFTILIQYINYNYSLPKSLLAYINKLSDFFRKLRFKLFIKKERIRLSNKNLKNILNYYKLKQIILREINILNDKIYIYFNESSSFNDIYSQIIELWYLNPDYYDLDNIYKLEIHIKQNK